MLVGDLGSCLGEVLDGGFGVDGVPGDDGVGEEGDAFALEVLVFGTSPSQFPLVSEDELPAERVEGFAFVELAVDASAVLLVVEVAKQGDGFDDPPVFLDGSCELVLAGGGLEA